MTEDMRDAEWSSTGVLGRYVLRVRRMADLSQRDLAEAVGVSRGTIARIESGKGHVSPPLLAAILRIAGLRIAVVDEAGREVEPVPSDTVRDNGGRRFPAHLDVAPPDLEPRERLYSPRYDRPEARAWYHLRAERDRQRAKAPVVAGQDHPTLAELAQRRRLMRGRQPRVDPVPMPFIECLCPDACYLAPKCLPRCLCQCESTGGDARPDEEARPGAVG